MSRWFLCSYQHLIPAIQLSEQHGIDTYLHFIRRLIVHSQTRLFSPNPPPFDASTSLTFRLLVQETQRLARDPLLADRFSHGIDRGDVDVFRHFDLVRFVERVGLRPLERLVLSAAVVSCQARRELSSQAISMVRLEFENAVLSLCHNPCFDHTDLAPNQVAKLISNLLSSPPIDSPVLDAAQRQALIIAVQTKYGRDTATPILQSVIPNMRSVVPDLLPLTSLTRFLAFRLAFLWCSF